MVLWYGHLLKLNILFQMWWEVSCWEELKWAGRHQRMVLIVVFLSLSVFLCWDNVIVVQAWLGLAGCLSGPSWQSESSLGPLIVQGSNGRKNWVSGRAAHELWTNGNCGEIMQPVIKWGRQAVRQAVGVGGRCDSGQVLLTEHPFYVSYKDVCLRKQTGGRQRRLDAHLNPDILCMHIQMH